MAEMVASHLAHAVSGQRALLRRDAAAFPYVHHPLLNARQPPGN